MSGPPNVTETVFAALPIGGPRSNLIASPFQFLMTGEDNLLLTAWTDTGGYSVEVTGRYLKPSGEIIPFNRRLTAGLTTAGAEQLLNLGPGFLLNLSMISIFPFVPSGRLFARLDVVRGSVGARIVLGTLLAGYVTSSAYLAWPGSTLLNPWEGQPYVRRLTIGSPGPGVTPNQTLGALQRWNIVGVSGDLLTDADAVSTRPMVQIARSGGALYRLPSIGLHNGSQQMRHHWVAGLGGSDRVSTFDALNGLPSDLWALPTDTLTLSAENFDAGDEWTNVEFLVRQFLEL